jgi:two-component system LytT family sensor kinase
MTGPTELVHLVGFLTGAALYSMLLAMVTRRSPVDGLALAIAVLGCVWNAGELGALVFRSVSLEAPERWLHVSSYTALGLLGAVVVHSVARLAVEAGVRWSALVMRLVARVGYGCAVLAGILHFRAAVIGSPLPSGAGLAIDTGSLAVLVIPLIAVTRREAVGRRVSWMAGLAVLAVSALHLSQYHGGNESWGLALVGHHASIPLAFAILYRDYRFALADLFLKRALTLLALVLLAFAGYSMTAPLIDSPAGVSALLALWIATALLLPWLRREITLFVDRVVLQRANYAQLLEQLAQELQAEESVEGVLDRACSLLAPALTATRVSWSDASSGPASGSIAIVTAESPCFALSVGGLAGGRRLLSDDITMLERAAMLTARRIDALRLTGERYERMLREREIRAMATEAELRALRAQVNPHFLFNALTTIGYLIENAPARALGTLIQLTTLLRVSLRSEGEFTTFGRELELIDCYLCIELARFEERLQVSVMVPPELHLLQMPSFLVQPLVENAVKHGIAGARHGGLVEVTARIEDAASTPILRITVRNTGAPLRQRRPRSGGVGLRSVEQRLRNYYGEEAGFALRQDPDGATVAEIYFPVGEAEDPNVAMMARNAAR